MTQALRVVFTLVFVASVSLPAPLLAQDAESDDTEHGVQRADMDLSADPGQDFYRYATGGWQDRTEIPPDEAIYGVRQEVEDRATEQLLALLDELNESGQLPVGSDAWKAVQLYSQATDLETRNSQGIAPIADELAQIDAIRNHDEFYQFLRDGYLTTHISGLYWLNIAPDYEDSSVQAAWLYGPFFGLYSRDYYWGDDEGNEEIRTAYRDMLATLFGAIGYDSARAEDAAQRVYDFEKQLTEPILSPEELTDPAAAYHPWPIADVMEATSAFDWPGHLERLGIPELETVIVPEEKYLEAVDAIVAASDLETLQDYLKWQVLYETADSLSEEMEEAAFAFYGTTLEGIEEPAPIEERALTLVNDNLGFALGKLYVDEYFSPDAKAQIETLGDELVAATRTRFEALDWMTPETKEAALAKLDAMRLKVGYPDEWRTYEDVTIEESLAQTLLSATTAEKRRWLARTGEAVDREEWFSPPQIVSAYINDSNNEIVFSAAILQPPFFDAQADPASNYGGIGTIIANEITAGFDAFGAQFGPDGSLTNWWTEDDYAQYEALTADVVEQYSAIEVLPGLRVNGELSLTENTADLGGVQIAYAALQAALAESGDPGRIDELTQDQRFFIAYALSWAAEAREEFLRTLVENFWEAPPQVRAVQPLRNMDAFYEAFDIAPGDPMYLAPEDRIVIW
jgi:predicted metalloendopeptidase